MSFDLVKASQHGLGHLLNPTDPESPNRDWINDTWQWVISDALELPVSDPSWLDVPAVGRLAISSPHLHRLLTALNEDLAYHEQIKPFNFLLIAFVSVLERPADDQQMVLIAPYANNSRDWLQMPWINRYSTRTYTITPTPSEGYERDGLLTVKTHRDILAEYATHTEAKSADPTGGPCTRRTTGLLERRHVTARTITHIGKEANQLEDVQAGLHARQDDVLNAYDDTEQLRFEAALPRLRELGPREIARRTGHSLGAIHAVLADKSQPRQAARARYIRASKQPA